MEIEIFRLDRKLKSEFVLVSVFDPLLSSHPVLPIRITRLSTGETHGKPNRRETFLLSPDDFVNRVRSFHFSVFS